MNASGQGGVCVVSSVLPESRYDGKSRVSLTESLGPVTHTLCCSYLPGCPALWVCVLCVQKSVPENRKNTRKDEATGLTR